VLTVNLCMAREEKVLFLDVVAKVEILDLVLFVCVEFVVGSPCSVFFVLSSLVFI